MKKESREKRKEEGREGGWKGWRKGGRPYYHHHEYNPLLILPIRIGVSGSEGLVLHKSTDNLPRHCAAKNIPISFINCKCYIQTKVLPQKASECSDV